MMGGSDELIVHIERVLPASWSLVFTANTEPRQLAKWWGPKGFEAPGLEINLRVGGSYRIAMQPPDTSLFHLSGGFLEIEPPSRLVYTFRWDEPDPDDRETVVTISLEDMGESTVMTVDQGLFATEGRRSLHLQGWTESLDRLHDLLSKPGPAP